MMTINLLPWRDHLRARRLRKKMLARGMGIFLLCMAGSGFFWHQPRVPLPEVVPASLPLTDTTESDLQKMRFVGYVHQQSRTWGLLLLPNGKTEDVQLGMTVGHDGARVSAIEEKHIIFVLPNHTFYTLPLAGI
jgi:hypothetical protein